MHLTHNYAPFWARDKVTDTLEANGRARESCWALAII